MKRLLALVAGLVLAAVACEPAPPSEPVVDTETRSAFPQGSSTGPELSGFDEEALPSCGHDGSWTITTDGTIVEACRHVGLIRVEAEGVILRNVIVEGTSLSPVVRNESSHLQVERSIIRSGRPTGSQPCAASIAYANYTAVESEFTGCADGVKVGGEVTLDKVFIHDVTRWCDPATGDCTHNDAIQQNDTAGVTRTLHFTMTGSSVYMRSCMSNRIIQAPNLVNSTFHLSRNFLYGSHGLLNIDKLSDVSNTGAVVENLFAGSATSGPFTASNGHAAPGLFTGIGVTNISRTGNYFEDGTEVPADGKMEPYSCGPTSAPTTPPTPTSP